MAYFLFFPKLFFWPFLAPLKEVKITLLGSKKAVLVQCSLRPAESPGSIQPSFLMFLESLRLVLEVYFLFCPKLIFWPFSAPSGGQNNTFRVQKGRFGTMFIPARRVPRANSVFRVTSLIMRNI